MDINSFLDDFSKANNVTALWQLVDNPYRRVKELTIVLQGNIKRVKATYLYPIEGYIDFPLLKEKLENLLCELRREEEDNNG